MSGNNTNKGEFSSLAEKVTPKPLPVTGNGGIQWVYATPLLFAPALPIIRHFMKNSSPKARMYVYLGTVGAALAHGFVLISKASGSDPKSA